MKPQHIMILPQHKIMKPQHVIMNPQHIIMKSLHIIMKPQHIIMKPQHIIMKPQHIIMIPQHIIMIPQHIIKSPNKRQQWRSISFSSVRNAVDFLTWHDSFKTAMMCTFYLRATCISRHSKTCCNRVIFWRPCHSYLMGGTYNCNKTLILL